MSGLRETFVRLELRDDASSALTRIDNLLNRITGGFASLGTQADSSTTGFAGMSQEITRLNDRLDSATTTMSSMHQEINRSNQEINQLRSIAARLEQELASARQEIDELSSGTQELTANASEAEASFGALATTVAGISASLAVGAVAFGQTLMQDAMEMDEAFGRLEARTGASAEDLAQLEGAAKEVFIGGFADSIGEASESVSTFSAMFNDLGTGDLTVVVEGAHTIAKAWDQEAKQVGKTVATMTKTFEGLSETEALDLITVGFERTGDYSEDLLDTFNEYSTQFKALGYDAEGFTATLIAGAESGAFNFDKLADTAKEGFLKMGEGSKDTRSALVAMGLDADQVINGIGQGGDEAQKAFMGVSTALASVEDPAKRTELAIAAFGTPLEDLGPQFATFFGSVNQDLGDFEGATQRASDSMMDRFGPRMTSAWRDLKLSIIDAFSGEGTQNFLGTLADDIEGALPSIKEGLASFGETISNNIMPAYEKFKTGLGWLIDNKDTIISVGTGLVAGFAVFKGVEMAKGLFDVVKNIGKIGLLSNPIGIAAVAIGGLVAAGVYLYQNWDTVKAKAEELWTKLRENPMMALVAGPIGAVVAAGIYLYNNWDTIKAKAGELWTTATEKFAGIKQAVSDFVSPAIGWFDSLSGKWNDFKTAISNFKVPEWMSKIGGTIGSGIDKVNSWVGADGSHATGLASVPFDGYIAELHKGEAVLTAQQSNTLRAAGMLSGNGNGTPNLNLDAASNFGQSTVLQPSMSSGVGLTSPVSSVQQSPQITPPTSNRSQSAHVSIPININVNGSADTPTLEQLKALLTTELDTKVRKILEDLFRRELAGLEG